MRLEVLREFDPWKDELCTCPRKYSLQPYTGCSFYCLYCYATSYIGRKPSIPKKNFVQRLERDLRKADKGKVVNLSTSSDPYPWIESRLRLTRKALELLLSRGFKVLITTKSHLVTNDIDLLKGKKAAVMITVTTLREDVARKLEPGAPAPSLRLRAIRELSEEGIPVGVRIDPIIPSVNDDEDEIKELVEAVASMGARHVTTSTYKARPDNLKRMVSAFPTIKEFYSSGERVGGYIYLKREMREKLLRPVSEEAKRLGLTVAYCREGFPFEAPSCDGSHLIPSH